MSGWIKTLTLISCLMLAVISHGQDYALRKEGTCNCCVNYFLGIDEQHPYSIQPFLDSIPHLSAYRLIKTFPPKLMRQEGYRKVSITMIPYKLYKTNPRKKQILVRKIPTRERPQLSIEFNTSGYPTKTLLHERTGNAPPELVYHWTQSRLDSVVSKTVKSSFYSASLQRRVTTSSLSTGYGYNQRNQVTTLTTNQIDADSNNMVMQVNYEQGRMNQIVLNYTGLTGFGTRRTKVSSSKYSSYEFIPKDHRVTESGFYKLQPRSSPDLQYRDNFINDSLGRFSRFMYYGFGIDMKFTYDSLGRLSQMERTDLAGNNSECGDLGHSTLKFTYNNQGLPVHVDRLIAGYNCILRFHYE